MGEPDYRNGDGVGNGVIRSNPSPGVYFKTYVADRPAHTSRLRAAESTLDVSISLARTLKEVWPVFKDFNLWMSRFGYLWDGIPGDMEDAYVCLSNKSDAANANWSNSRTKYLVRKVIPERLIYLDTPPEPIPGKEGVWTGHNLFTLYEQDKHTKIVSVMEHTYFSETMNIEELRAEAGGVDAGMVFWRDYFIPDLVAAIEARATSGV